MRLWEAASRLERRPEFFALRLPIGHLLTSIPIRKRDVVGIRRQAAQEAPNMHAACRGADEQGRRFRIKAGSARGSAHAELTGSDVELSYKSYWRSGESGGFGRDCKTLY